MSIVRPDPDAAEETLTEDSALVMFSIALLLYVMVFEH